MYTQGESERLVGEAFKDHRQQVIIASKFGYVLPRQKQFVNRIKPILKPVVARLGLKSHRVHAGLRGTVSDQDFSPAYIRASIEASLRRLQTDYIDVYQLHDPPLDVIKRGDFVEALERLQRDGKIRCWGVAGQDPSDAVTALQYASIGSIQVGLSVLEQAALDGAIPTATQRGVGIIARQVFASGLLTRPVDRLDLADIDSEPVVAQRKKDQLAEYSAIVQRVGRERSEMALHFSLSHPEVSVVLLGASRSDQLDTALRQLESHPLSDEERALLIGCRRSGR